MSRREHWQPTPLPAGELKADTARVFTLISHRFETITSIVAPTVEQAKQRADTEMSDLQALGLEPRRSVVLGSNPARVHIFHGDHNR